MSEPKKRKIIGKTKLASRRKNITPLATEAIGSPQMFVILFLWFFQICYFKFATSSISVRRKSAVNFLYEIGLSAKVMCDIWP